MALPDNGPFGNSPFGAGSFLDMLPGWPDSGVGFGGTDADGAAFGTGGHGSDVRGWHTFTGLDGGYGGDPYGQGTFLPPYFIDGGYGGDPYGQGTFVSPSESDGGYGGDPYGDVFQLGWRAAPPLMYGFGCHGYGDPFGDPSFFPPPVPPPGYGTEGYGLDFYGGMGLPFTAQNLMDITVIDPETLWVYFFDVPHPDVGIVGNWFFVNITPFPITLTALSVTWPFMGDPQRAMLKVKGMTLIHYYGAVNTADGMLVDDFWGLGAWANDTLWTPRGPLIKNWGDDTPATVQDVHVYVGALQGEVAVAEVNPYIGRVKTAIPIPLLPPGDPDALVTVDYQWTPAPIMSFAGLGVEGLVLGKWDRNGTFGRSARFPMGIVLGSPHERPEPVLIGHRWMGVERAYSAVLGSQDTLLLGQSPRSFAKRGFERTPEAISAVYDGTTDPSTDWTPFGDDHGQVNTGQPGEIGPVGTYTQRADGSAPAFYLKAMDPTFPNLFTAIGRFEITETTPDGIFTGVGFGCQDYRRLAFGGALLINGVHHLGLLLDPAHAHEVGGWDIGPKALGRVTTADTITFTSADIPGALRAGRDADHGVSRDRFQILDGPQAGVYTLTKVVRHTDGTTVLTVTPPFPADFRRYGNRDATACFEVDWEPLSASDPLYYRPVTCWLYATAAGIEFRVSSAITGGTSSLIGSTTTVPVPAEWLSVGDTDSGALWGTVRRAGQPSGPCTSTWSFFRFSEVPDPTFFHTQSVSENLDLSKAPEDTSSWARTGNDGCTAPVGADLVLHSFADDPYGYLRLEPFFQPDTYLDWRTKMRADPSPWLPLIWGFQGPQRDCMLAALAYVESGGTRAVWTGAFTSCPVLYGQQDIYWEDVPGVTLTRRDTFLEIDQRDSQTGGVVFTSGGLWGAQEVWEARLAIRECTAGAGGLTGIRFGRQAKAAPDRMVVVEFLADPPRVQLTDGATPVSSVAFDWDDGLPHLYRITVDRTGAQVALSIDDGAPVLTALLNLFGAGLGLSDGFLGVQVDPGASASSRVEWYGLTFWQTPPAGIKRTFGIPKPNTEAGDIDNWDLPRTDSTTAPNSDAVNAVVQEMDWTSLCDVRLLYNPGWGVSLYRPDLPPPPYYTGPVTPGFLETTTNISAAWINVETARLALGPPGSPFGRLLFAAAGLARTFWRTISYRIFRSTGTDMRAPQGMVLGRANPVTSGESKKDVTPEVVSVQSLDRLRVSLVPTNLTATLIYKIVDGLVTYLPGDFLFDTAAQMATLVEQTDGTPRRFSADHAAVQVVFAPGNPVTETYLKSQPLLRGTTNLNERTPPFAKGVGGNSLMPRYGGRNQTLTPPETRPTLKFMGVRDSGQEGLIACYDEGAMGDFQIEISGPLLSESQVIPHPPYNQRAGSPGSFFHASGGPYVAPVANGSGKVRPYSLYATGGAIGPCQNMALVWPNSHSAANRGAGQLQLAGFLRIPNEEVFRSLFEDEWLNPPPPP